jgi:hypothetical protein
MSDHFAGRWLGRPSGHFAWSLTPRYCPWRPRRQWLHQAGGTERRPRTTGCNLHDDLQLSAQARRAPVMFFGQDKSSTQTNPGGTPRAEGCSPPCSPPVFPLDTLVLTATMVVVVPVKDSGLVEGEWQLWRSIRRQSTAVIEEGSPWIAT